MTINPYELLGVDPHKTTLSQLKKTYYHLALLIHPDKSSNPNASIEMDVIHNAYLYCRGQIQNAVDKETTFENLEKEFERFCKTQEDAAPTFRDIVDDVMELKKFNDAFVETDGYRASFTGGYGDVMEASLFKQHDSNISNIDMDDDVQQPLSNDFSSLTVYKEPISFTNEGGDLYDYQKEDPVRSFTVYLKKTCLTDYKEANETMNEASEYNNSDLRTSRTYDELLAERETT